MADDPVYDTGGVVIRQGHETALHQAVLHDNLEAVHALLAGGANPDHRTVSHRDGDAEDDDSPVPFVAFDGETPRELADRLDRSDIVAAMAQVD